MLRVHNKLQRNSYSNVAYKLSPLSKAYKDFSKLFLEQNPNIRTELSCRALIKLNNKIGKIKISAYQFILSKPP